MKCIYCLFLLIGDFGILNGPNQLNMSISMSSSGSAFVNGITSVLLNKPLLDSLTICRCSFFCFNLSLC